MIITCSNCRKQFKIDSSLIPSEGRNLQCGSCDNVWFYKFEDKSIKPTPLNEDVAKNDIEPKKIIKDYDEIIENNKPISKNKAEKVEKKVKKFVEKQNLSTSKNETDSPGSKFLSYLLVFIISFLALIILLDTLKASLINIFPGLEFILFNLYETLQDIKLFIIDLY